MKKSIVLILLFSVLVLLFAACGGKTAGDTASNEDTIAVTDGVTVEADDTEDEEDAENDMEVEAEQEDASAGDPQGIYREEGSELTDFLGSFMEAEKVFSDPIGSIKDLPATRLMDMAIPNAAMITLPSYDVLDYEDLPKEEGNLLLGGYKGVREKKGNTITISGQREYMEDAEFGSTKKGDIFSEKGSLDTSNNTLLYEASTERAGSVIGRTVLEIVILKDGTYLLQYLDVSSSSAEGEPPKGEAVFKRFNKDEFSAVLANFDGNTAFTYDSIAGRGDVKTEDMARNCTVTGKFAVTGGKGSFTK